MVPNLPNDVLDDGGGDTDPCELILLVIILEREVDEIDVDIISFGDESSKNWW
jgi:hypothetical protein